MHHGVLFTQFNLDKKLLSSEAIISLPRMFSGLCRNLQMLQINGSLLISMRLPREHVNAPSLAFYLLQTGLIWTEMQRTNKSQTPPVGGEKKQKAGNQKNCSVSGVKKARNSDLLTCSLLTPRSAASRLISSSDSKETSPRFPSTDTFSWSSST